MATLPYQEYFGRDLYGQLGPDVSYPDLIGPGILGQSINTGGILDGDITCPEGTSRDASGKCVKTTGVTSDGGCPHGFLSDGKGGCTTANTCPGGGQPPCDDDNGGTKTCAQKGKCPDGAGGCKECDPGVKTCASEGKVGTWPNCRDIDVNGGCGSNNDCSGGQVCINGKCKDAGTVTGPNTCGEGEIWSGGECHSTGEKCPDPNTHWDTFVGRCLPNKEGLAACQWGRNPHTDQCNPNPYFSDWGSTDPENPYGSPTALGGLPRDTGSGSSAYISGAGLEALDRELYPSGFVPQSGILSGPEDMFSDGAYMGGSILDTGGPTEAEKAIIARREQEKVDARREQREQDAIRMNIAPPVIAPPVTAPPVTNILDNVITKDTDWIQKSLDAHREMQERDRKWREEQMKGQYSFF